MLDTIQVDPRDLKPNPWNTNHVEPENEQKLEASIKRFGMFKPILVRERADGALEIIGGEHRSGVAARMGLKTVPVINLGPIDDKQAKEIGLVDNGRYGSDDSISLAELLEELGDAEELTGFLPYDEADIASIFSSVSIDIDDLDLTEDDEDEPVSGPESKAPRTHTMMRFKVPVEDAERIAEIIKKTQKEQGLTAADEATNAGDALVHLLLAQD